MLRSLFAFFLSISCLSVVVAQRWNPDFSQLQQPYRDYYQQLYGDYMREVDGAYESQRNYLMQQPGYMQQNTEYKKNLLEMYRSQGSRMDEFGNIVAGDPNAPTYLTCNGRGCNARG